MLELRDYQERSLDELEAYFALATQQGAKRAFIEQTDRPYHPVPSLPELPYVCLRIPTGGGKTLMACHALGIATRSFLRADRTVCLWLVPTNTIREQTLAALRNREHPYRQALDSRFGGQVTVLDVAQALYVQRGDLDGSTVIIVATLAAFRVEDTEGRKVYEDAGALLPHFADLPAEALAGLERSDEGVLLRSLANVLRVRRPVVIMDEAHNARTPLSFDTLSRFMPSCIIEFTATPETTYLPNKEKFASNVLYQVSALELKEAHMIKLPIRLQTRADWQQVLADTVQMQRALEDIAREEERETGEYLRPIVLLQAQPRRQGRKTLTVDVLRKSLLEDFHVPQEEVAIETGEVRELEGEDLYSRECPIRFIITVQALREGWDCPFAYILCSVADISSARSVEQILGRILRLPGAKPRRKPELSYAYAFVASQHFAQAAASLRDALVENHGFQRMEAAELVVRAPDPSLDYGGLFAEGEGAGPITATAGARPIRVPYLAIRVGGQLEILEETHFLDREWNLADCDPTLSRSEFALESGTAERLEIDVTERGRLEVRFVEHLHDQLALLAAESGWTVAKLTNSLDHAIEHHDIAQVQSSLFIRRAIEGLISSRGVTVDQLVRDRYRLRFALQTKIAAYRDEHRADSYQRLLLADASTPVEVTPDFCLAYGPEAYTPSEYYEGPFAFQKHYYSKVGELKPEGEEFECAQFLDTRPEVECWVRNLVKRPNASFWLQTSTDKFYPDFVARLRDGRILVVECKGAHLWDGPDAKEKRDIGELWADRSNGRCLFVMPKGPDWNAITACIGRA